MRETLQQEDNIDDYLSRIQSDQPTVHKSSKHLGSFPLVSLSL